MTLHLWHLKDCGTLNGSHLHSHYKKGMAQVTPVEEIVEKQGKPPWQRSRGWVSAKT